jgi:TPR repeat protein
VIGGNIVTRNIVNGFRYLKLSAENGNSEGQFAIACMAENGIGTFSSVDAVTAAEYYERCSDCFPEASLCFGRCLQTCFGIGMDFMVASEFLKRAADLDDLDGINSFGCCLEQGQCVDRNIEMSVWHYRQAASHFDSHGMFNVGRCLEYGRGIEKDLHRAAKYYRLSAEQRNASA